VDDIIPTLVAYQIEWNKLHRVLAGEKNHWPADGPPPAEMLTDLWQRLPSSEADWEHLREIWGADFASNLRHIADGEKSMRVQMLGGTHLGYARSTARWWNPILDLMVRERLAERPVYFISSNPHSIVNLLSGTARRRHQDIVRFIETTGHAELLPELQKLRSGQQPGTWDNFLYYAARVYYGNHPEAPALRAERTREEEARGLFYIPSRSGIDVAAQVITLDRLEPGALDAAAAAQSGHPHQHQLSAGDGGLQHPAAGGPQRGVAARHVPAGQGRHAQREHRGRDDQQRRLR
jgi:hypothetical protein